MGVVHDKLAEELALAIGPSPFLDVNLGSSWLSKYGEGPARADVVTIFPSYTQFCVSIYEVKASREDFYSDIKTDKWKLYLPHCHRFYFATPAGMLVKSEIPTEAGWIVQENGSWKIKKHPKLRKVNVPEQTLQALLFAKQRKNFRQRRLEALKKAIEEAAAKDIYAHRRERRCDPTALAKLVGKELAEVYVQKQEIAAMHKEAAEGVEDMASLYEEFRKVCIDFMPEGYREKVSAYRVLHDLKNILTKAQEKPKNI